MLEDECDIFGFNIYIISFIWRLFKSVFVFTDCALHFQCFLSAATGLQIVKRPFNIRSPSIYIMWQKYSLFYISLGLFDEKI